GEDALFALSAGFNGILVGEAVMRNPGLIPEIREVYARDGGDFWPRLFSRKLKERPLVKICGITNKEDACRAAELGADMLGFIFAESPRRAEPALARELADLDILKVGVVVAGAKARLDDRISGLLEDGLLSAIQFHGDEQPAACFKSAFPYYKVLQLKGADDIHAIAGYRCPRVLVDAPAGNLRGGTGKTLGSELIEKAKQEKPLWLAGGLGPHNITDIIRRFEPELVDAASRLEAAPGKKDPDLLTTYFKEIERAQIL
ncbi:MAG: bifunctional indole-3-glycerol phosphate synthase/phosphoribosylanthranilate isomerase, partial [Spirochaetia bacterium]